MYPRFLAKIVIGCLGAVLATGMPMVGNSAVESSEPYTMSLIASLTGPVAFVGKGIAQDVMLVEKIVNNTGGIQGHPLKIDVLDDGSSPQVAVQLANQVIARNEAVFIGPAYTGTCLAAAPLLAKSGPVSMCISPTLSPTRGGYIFSAATNAVDTIHACIRYFRARGWNRVAWIISTDAGGQTFDRALDTVMGLPDRGAVQVVARERFGFSDITVAAQMSRIKAAEPDVLMTFTSGTPFGTVLRAYTESGSGFPVVSTPANMTYEQMQQYKPFLPKALLFAAYRSQLPSASLPGPVKEAQKIYIDGFRSIGVRPDIGNALAWDPIWQAIDALRHLGVKATAPQVRDYIMNLHGWVGIDGVYDFSDAEQRGIGITGIVMAQWDAAKNDFAGISGPGGILR